MTFPGGKVKRVRVRRVAGFAAQGQKAATGRPAPHAAGICKYYTLKQRAEASAIGFAFIGFFSLRGFFLPGREASRGMGARVFPMASCRPCSSRRSGNMVNRFAPEGAHGLPFQCGGAGRCESPWGEVFLQRNGTSFRSILPLFLFLACRPAFRYNARGTRDRVSAVKIIEKRSEWHVKQRYGLYNRPAVRQWRP